MREAHEFMFKIKQAEPLPMSSPRVVCDDHSSQTEGSARPAFTRNTIDPSLAAGAFVLPVIAHRHTAHPIARKRPHTLKIFDIGYVTGAVLGLKYNESTSGMSEET
jgi:hypothetical protein